VASRFSTQTIKTKVDSMEEAYLVTWWLILSLIVI